MRRGRTARRRRRRAVRTRGALVLDAEWTDLRDWCRAQGMPATKLALARFPDTCRGMMATAEIRAGEDLVRVPERLLVTASRVRRATLARARTPSTSAWRLSEHQALAYWVYAEAAASLPSAWRRYTRTIPADFDSVPLSALSGDCPSDSLSTATPAAQWVATHLPRAAARRAAEQQTRLFDDWTRTRAVLATVGAAPPTDWRRYVWAWLAVNTRCIHLGRPAEGGQDTIALAPVLDMLNHSHHAKIATRFDSARGQFVIQTLRGYRKGEEVFISYGPHDNAFLLAEYGFVSAGNPHQALELDREVDAWLGAAACGGDALAAALRRHGLWGDFTLSLDDPDPSYRLQAALRLGLAARETGLGAGGAVAMWERWRRGVRACDSNEAAMAAAMQQWIQRTCRTVAGASGQMVRDAQAAVQRPPAPGRPHRFLAHCLGVIWLEAHETARRWASCQPGDAGSASACAGAQL
ncbi:hypothetical protein IWQ57_002146 [Coemansia nantahalensis]|uniref:Uncharacterized protein n=1 Tax=Coemansia nantahalensis TaxID=2789366 RepID=A0ACC1K1S4_9FUNG|nr:hypothetical protein IWQ57_002146 [Coemansia nantahalensis]